jgi:hypothetical protein
MRIRERICAGDGRTKFVLSPDRRHEGTFEANAMFTIERTSPCSIDRPAHMHAIGDAGIMANRASLRFDNGEWSTSWGRHRSRLQGRGE